MDETKTRADDVSKRDYVKPIVEEEVVIETTSTGPVPTAFDCS